MEKEKLMTFLSSTGFVVCMEMLIIMLLIAVIIVRHRVRKQARERMLKTLRQRREEELDKKIMNAKKPGGYRYQGIDADKKLTISIVSPSGTSSGERVFDMYQDVRIGRDLSNDLVLESQYVARKHGVLIWQENKLYLRVLSWTNPSSLIRKGRKERIQGEMTALADGDRLMLADTGIEIRLA